MGRQVSDKPQGRKPRAGIRLGGAAGSVYGDLTAGGGLAGAGLRAVDEVTRAAARPDGEPGVFRRQTWPRQVLKIVLSLNDLVRRLIKGGR